MGLEIGRETFEPAEFAAFEARLAGSLAALRALLGRPGFGAGPDDRPAARTLTRPGRLPRVPA